MLSQARAQALPRGPRAPKHCTTWPQSPSSKFRIILARIYVYVYIRTMCVHTEVCICIWTGLLRVLYAVYCHDSIHLHVSILLPACLFSCAHGFSSSAFDFSFDATGEGFNANLTCPLFFLCSMIEVGRGEGVGSIAGRGTGSIL